MLFSDMEGSTRLLARLGDGYGDRCRPSAAAREAFGRHNGTELGTEETASSSSARLRTRSRLRAGTAQPGKPGLARWCGARIRMACTPASPPGTATAMSEWTSTGRADRCRRARRPGDHVEPPALADGKLPGPRRRSGLAPAEGHRRARAPASAADRRPAPGSRRCAAGPPRQPAEPPAPLLARDTDLAAVTELVAVPVGPDRDPHRARRGRQVPAGAGRGPGGRSSLRGRCLLRPWLRSRRRR